MSISRDGLPADDCPRAVLAALARNHPPGPSNDSRTRPGPRRPGRLAAGQRGHSGLCRARRGGARAGRRRRLPRGRGRSSERPPSGAVLELRPRHPRRHGRRARPLHGVQRRPLRRVRGWFGQAALFTRTVPTASAVGIGSARWRSMRSAPATPACRSRTRGRCPRIAIRRATARCRRASRAARSCAASGATRRRRRGPLLVGGTASIVGENSLHDRDARQQALETFENLAELVAAARRQVGGDAGRPRRAARGLRRLHRAARLHRPRQRRAAAARDGDRALRPHGADRVRAGRSLPARAAGGDRRPRHALARPAAQRGSRPASPTDAHDAAVGRHLAFDLVEPAHPSDHARRRFEHVAGRRRAGKFEAAERRDAQRERLARAPRRCRSPARRSAPAARPARSPAPPARPENGRRRTSRRPRSDAGRRP